MSRTVGVGYSDATNWHQFNVPTMWTLLADQETDNHWRQVAGWRKTYELTSLHLSRLLSYRDKLAAVWPPEKSPAAAAYLAQMDHLIDNVRQTYETAAANYTTLSTAISALQVARSKLKKLYDEYVAKQQQKQEYEQHVAALPPPPGWAAHLPPPVTDTDLQHLDARARSIMQDLSGTLIEARVQVRQPPAYQPWKTRVPGDPDAYGAAGSPPPPVIPPIVPVPTPVAPVAPVAATAQPAGPVAPTKGMGPVLGGTSPVISPPAPATPVGPGTITPAPAASPGAGPIVPPGLSAGPGTLPRPGVGGRAMSSAPTGRGAPGHPSPGGGSGLPRTMPPGGVIGGPPGAGLGQPAAGTAATRRVNPVGGVISGQRPGVGSGPLPMSPNGGQPVGTTAGQRSDDRGRRWDPDHPWETEEGVDPVVVPPREVNRIDPGPVIGLNR